MNYGEENAFWYLRLNGFFPISNFVIHKSSKTAYSSDCDILAVRPPHVYEEIGGRSDDWDSDLLGQLDVGLTIGMICEVKTGDYRLEGIFRLENVQYSIGRLGFVKSDEISDIAHELNSASMVKVNHEYQICKLLISNKRSNSSNFLFRDFDSIKAFIRKRVQKYPKEKYRDRMFFDSILMQSIIDDETSQPSP